ncbi:hypothetical protein ColTof4_07842 [Colletotrichum tofieldiae]|nr:hypothetical protein ColTof3_02629 [Colletotrichum tofieldiae]GKT75419.1 hypothetical protein ColTof4_07842 [Colletotrichum tofieldiae]
MACPVEGVKKAREGETLLTATATDKQQQNATCIMFSTKRDICDSSEEASKGAEDLSPTVRSGIGGREPRAVSREGRRTSSPTTCPRTVPDTDDEQPRVVESTVSRPTTR